MSKEIILNAYVQASYKIWQLAGDIDAGKWLKSQNENEGKNTKWAERAIAIATAKQERAKRQLAYFARRLKAVPVEELK